MSVDPLTKSYPWYTPYQFAGNKPIWAIDIDGLEEGVYQWSTNQAEGTTQLKAANSSSMHIENQLLSLKSYKRQKGDGNQPYEYTYSNQYSDLNLNSARGLIETSFKQGFSNYLPKRFINHYSLGNGNEYNLNKHEVADLSIMPTGIQGRIKQDREKFDQIYKSLKIGESIKLDNYSIRGGSLNSGAVGNFTIYFKGKLTKTEQGINFIGQMQLYDLWDFDEGKSPDRPELANKLVKFGNDHLEGIPFEIKSDWIDVEQKDANRLDFFENHDSKEKLNRVSKIVKTYRKVTDVKSN